MPIVVPVLKIVHRVLGDGIFYGMLPDFNAKAVKEWITAILLENKPIRSYFTRMFYSPYKNEDFGVRGALLKIYDEGFSMIATYTLARFMPVVGPAPDLVVADADAPYPVLPAPIPQLVPRRRLGRDRGKRECWRSFGYTMLVFAFLFILGLESWLHWDLFPRVSISFK